MRKHKVLHQQPAQTLVSVAIFHFVWQKNLALRRPSMVTVCVLFAWSISSMDIDYCFISEGPETPVLKLAWVTLKDYPILLACAEAVGNAAILDHLQMKESWRNRRLRYHFKCKSDLYNNLVKVTLKTIICS